MNNDAKGMFTIHISFSQVWSHKHFTHTKIVILLFIFSESRTKNQRIFAFTWWKFWLFVLCFAYLCMINFVCDVFVTLENAMWIYGNWSWMRYGIIETKYTSAKYMLCRKTKKNILFVMSNRLNENISCAKKLAEFLTCEIVP